MSINSLNAVLAATFLSEDSDTGCDHLNLIRALAAEVNATDFDYQEGVCTFTVTGPESASELIAALDEEECVEAYDVMHDGEEDEEEILRLGEQVQFSFIVALSQDFVTYGTASLEMEDLDEGFGHGVQPYALDIYGVATSLDEVKKTMRVNFKGAKRLKMQCPAGFKFNATTKSCEKIAGDELAKRRKASIRALVTRKAGGEALKKRANIRTKKAMGFRKSLGLK